ncbi:hypothetical protein ABG768_007485, partial [Culter alburnus]
NVKMDVSYESLLLGAQPWRRLVLSRCRDSEDIVISSLTELRLPHPTVANDTLTS